jgi:hypothetical protein
MADDRMPHQIIDDMTAARERLCDADVLEELRAIPPLADESDPCWAIDDYWQKVAYPYLALWNIAAQRRLRLAIPLILGRACFGDPGEIMRNLCHALEAIAKPNWSELTQPCVAALSSPWAGTRLWAAHELQRLRDPVAIPALEQAAKDQVAWVREWIDAALQSTRGAT